ncbi:hypothetical protein QEJ31_08260 [Pigmentibacter sp. JX0631]|uniref:hypothetical protein n=1 Tax=Pigmentibacter sp. JX0631 TaxID=2976982 RepID=UPI002469551B|nr:hypothetical protein [Pigmentibacter sp. JX0631]WGL58532.1 hypothetical protein QEJ31_08260 [Pigmentibacter sp. JX0631]
MSSSIKIQNFANYKGIAMKKLFTLTGLCFSTALLFSSCSSTSKTYVLPNEEDYQGYEIIDAVDKDTVSLKVDQDDKIAVVIRDISTTSYNYLDPRYMNSMVKFEGKSNCCKPTSITMGASGNLVYKFSFIGKGKTVIKIIARHKGKLITANSFDDDKEFSINLEVD